jgi:23S rRNA C2498 (ribose-2'-O)-methylase RlmM
MILYAMQAQRENKNASMLMLCRPEFAGALGDECMDRGAAGTRELQGGLVQVDFDDTGLSECIFERQRMVNPGFVPECELKPLREETIRELLGLAASAKPLWTVHFLALEQAEADDAPDTKRLEGIWNNAVRLGKKIAPDIEKRFRPPHRLKPGGIVIQVLLTQDGLWFSHENVEAMLNPRPGGFTRQRFDALAPSRSYLKMEEALGRIPEQPQAGQRVIDLGAAPGGWTYAFLKRGCYVTAVDHGPMKLPDHQPGWGTVEHLRENGITYEPSTEVDWLVADMLIAPGVALGLLRRWLASGRARRIICNIKLPQEQAYQSVKPVEDLLRGQSRYSWSIKQLYHDRREVTVMAWRG